MCRARASSALLVRDSIAQCCGDLRRSNARIAL